MMLLNVCLCRVSVRQSVCSRTTLSQMQSASPPFIHSTPKCKLKDGVMVFTVRTTTSRQNSNSWMAHFSVMSCCPLIHSVISSLVLLTLIRRVLLSSLNHFSKQHNRTENQKGKYIIIFEMEDRCVTKHLVKI